MNINADGLNRHDGTFIVGSRSASMYIRGLVYHLVYSSVGDARRHRVTPEDAYRIPWRALSRVTGVEFDAARRITVIRLHFASTWRYRHYLYDFRYADVVLSTRNATVRLILDERRRRVQQMALPFAMGLHPRLGSSSVVQCLDDETIRAVIALL